MRRANSMQPQYKPTMLPCKCPRLVEESEDLAGDVLSPSLLVVHDASRGGEDDVAELTGWKELLDPLLHVLELDVVARGDDTSLVEAVKICQKVAIKLLNGKMLTGRSAE